MSAGSKDWFRQRVASTLLIPLSAWLLWAGVSLAGASYAEAGAFFANPLNALAAVFLAVIGLYHTQGGVQSIVEDYVPTQGLKSFCIFLSRVGCVAGAIAVTWAAVTFAFGA